MRCPECGCSANKVLDTRSIDDDRVVRRRRECVNCQRRFTTYETVESTPLMVCKRDNTREPFDRKKILNGLIKACQKRPVSIRQMESLIDSIESECYNNSKTEVTTAEIGECLMRGLRKLDPVAYIRFVSVYRKFDDVDSFFEEIMRLKNSQDQYEAQKENRSEEDPGEPL